MNDPRDNLDEELLDIDQVTAGDAQQALDDLYDQEDIDEPIGTDANETVAKKGGERIWVVLMIASIVLALLSSLVLSPMIASQERKVQQAQELIGEIKATNDTAEQSLSAAGDFDSIESNLGSLTKGVERFIAPEGTFNTLSATLLGNREATQQAAQAWDQYNSTAQQFVAGKTEVMDVKARVLGFSDGLSQAVIESVGFVEAVAKEGRNKSSSTAKDKYLFLTSEASNLSGILGRVSTTVRGYYIPTTNLSRLADSQNGLLVRLQDTLNRIVSNSAAIVGTAAEPLQQKYRSLGVVASELGEKSAAVTTARELTKKMRSEAVDLEQAVAAAGTPAATVTLLGRIKNFLPLFFALIFAYALWQFLKLQSSDLVAQEANLSETLADQQESILKLLDEMSALADGDLTVEAEVTDQITGAIADSVNFAVIEMRELVSQINRASIEVANESELAVNNAQSVSQSNMSQAEQITAAANLMQKVSNTISKMSEEASNSSDMAEESMKVAEQGAEAVRDTIRGMEDMREQIQDTSKRIKRLGESSQRIGDIVALIDDIAEQTNILSLNAAIQASMAGEAGRGFAVVSDEVQSLAERSTEATKKIGELVATIQTDTNDAVLSMEKATQQVVSGTQVADSAGSALSAIENVSKQLSGLIRGIAENSDQQAEVVTQVSEQVSQVSESSSETSRKAQASANSIAKLLELAKDLETSVSRFKLPTA